MLKPIRSALVSVYHKHGLEPLLRLLHQHEVHLYASGGTAQFIQSLGLPCTEVSDLTQYPSILGGRVKTLHPAVFGGILARQSDPAHQADLAQYKLPTFDLVIVDLYPFEDTLRETADPEALIEKIDIGGIALIRAGAKNHHDVAILPSRQHYAELTDLVQKQGASTTLEQRRRWAVAAFATSTAYDTAIGQWLGTQLQGEHPNALRYGENPHQQAHFFGQLNQLFTQLHGKALSYNNLLDLDGALRLIQDFPTHTTAIFKHANPCGVATRPTGPEAWAAALACDPTSAFGGIIVTQHPVEETTARAVQDIFFEILAAPAFTPEALNVLTAKNRILLQLNHPLHLPGTTVRTTLNGTLTQQVDLGLTAPANWAVKTERLPTAPETADLVFAEACAKHLKSNAICIVKDQQMIGAGMGQTSRIDALEQALTRARKYGFDLKGAVLASDGFFPFADSVQMAHEAGIEVFLQPGGSVRDADTIHYAQAHRLCMVFTGVRHFRH